MAAGESKLMVLMRTIAAGETASALQQLAASPALACERLKEGATRQNAGGFYLDEIRHYLYAGDSALHTAAAGYRYGIARKLIALGADVRAQNRRGAEPLHYAVVGIPGSSTWDPKAQVETIVCLIAAGADPNGVNKDGVTSLHRAVRTRCAAAVKALLEYGADPCGKNRNGSTPMLLATQNTGRGGAGSPEAKVQQEQIIHLLEQHAANR